MEGITPENKHTLLCVNGPLLCIMLFEKKKVRSTAHPLNTDVSPYMHQ